MAPQAGPQRVVRRSGHKLISSGVMVLLEKEYWRTFFVALMWIVTKLVADILQAHTAGSRNIGPATQDSEPVARMEMPLL